MRPRSQNRSWCTDGVHGGPASVNILLRWLERSGNYARWVSSDHRIRLCGEIVEEMEHHGIHHRSATIINLRIKMLKKHYERSREYHRRLAASQGNYDDPNGEGIFVADRTILGGRGWARLHNIMGHM
ncbi:hypothetical protein H4Q26_002391 [Puccinia striiformis f. sp. tritici PST-130]|uniref:Uncharacterized protein n=2 Tax=Puccinia striiformis TaxID=27350 RepID=A0A2S4W6F0_9BASI|nr:hypothetical protein Pst134EB_016320 [Puccinia striiformis f. sp. tritici]KAH9467029.1 hypothetical protein Pst134EB_002061 [Puccinia striiformis f. sp. tritici]KAI9603079.1 hypothetical protein H4Q26_002391 [Puccinia striiformis f. sp. tritici PST-130]POW17350.1 hypothetical protein PSTT_00756 [Puccinia striiformis]